MYDVIFCIVLIYFIVYEAYLLTVNFYRTIRVTGVYFIVYALFLICD
jgi:hypothetical protein